MNASILYTKVNGISPTEAHDKAKAFDAWLAGQPAAVKDTVEAHILTLKDKMPSHFGPDSAKVLLAELYLTVRKFDQRLGRYF